MDIVRSKPKSKLGKKWIVIGALSLVAMLSTYSFVFGSSASYSVDADTLLIDSVQQGELTITVRGMGVLAPKDVRWLATSVDGKVERIHAKAGALVSKGDLILELSNPQLMQTLEETKWELDELEAQTQALKVSLESEVLDQEAAVINEKLNYERASLTLDAQVKLLQQGVNAVSLIDHEAVKIEVAQNKQRWDLAVKRLEKQKENVAAQMLANEARVTRMRRSVKRIEDQVAELQVKASMDAIVQEMPMELGQQVNAGINLARLAKRDDFIAELQIAENQIQNVNIGQTVSIDTRTSVVEGIVKRIDPAVTNGVVQVDIDLIGEAPAEARPELTVEGTIQVAHLENALYVKRPMFAKRYGESSVYLVDADSNIASKHTVTFGQASTNYIEVKQGLSLGQSIIVSDVSAWDVHQQVQIN